MKFFKHLVQVSVVVSVLLASGCASVKQASPELDAAAKEFKKDPATSQVYVYRNETLGAALSMPVTVNGKLAGNTGPNSFFKFDLPAGEHELTSQGKESVLNITTENGEIYYIWQEVKMGAFSGGSLLQLVGEQEGQQGVKECSLIDATL
ncbi:DUF2846 domain-containing protein [Corallincola spongiicola]|uniref:DUF2846 domain-containing protein n=1 Tax=Corallincola spongiicola TaxID=2520508 RepID=A0ABY1WQE8_9GAMM|nr:DUF2846 domain-containing protein [Corallincola spongiicola]TAA46944.1 DUF2846 domain-containing protein [Corallincola spongiicola]